MLLGLWLRHIASCSYILTQPIFINLFATWPWLTCVLYMVASSWQLEQSVFDSALILLPILISLSTFSKVPVMGP